MIRAFLALELPETARHMFEHWQGMQKKTKRGPRFIDPKSLHVTLRFFGNLRQRQIDSIQEIVGALSLPPQIDTRVVGFGGFPSARKATVLVAKLEDREALLSSLYASLEAALLPIGFEAETRSFVPHVTLARMPGPGDVSAFAKNPSHLLPFSLSELTLFRSELGEQGARHFKLSSWPLHCPAG